MLIVATVSKSAIKYLITKCIFKWGGSIGSDEDSKVPTTHVVSFVFNEYNTETNYFAYKSYLKLCVTPIIMLKQTACIVQNVGIQSICASQNYETFRASPLLEPQI